MLAAARLAGAHRRFAGNGDVSDPDLCAGHSRNANGIAPRWNFSGGTRASYFRLRVGNNGEGKINGPRRNPGWRARHSLLAAQPRSEEHTSELQSRRDLVCRLLLEKKKLTANSRVG